MQMTDTFLPSSFLSRLHLFPRLVNVHLPAVLTQKVFFICNLEIIWAGICRGGRDNCELLRQVSRRKQYSQTPFWAVLTWISWDYGYTYVTPGLHIYFSDMSISISLRKWKRFLFLMLMLVSLPVYTAQLYLCSCLCLVHLRHVNSEECTWNENRKPRSQLPYSEQARLACKWWQASGPFLCKVCHQLWTLLKLDNKHEIHGSRPNCSVVGP